MLTVQVTVDDAAKALIQEVRDLVALAQSMANEIERQRKEIKELYDGMDAWAGRIQRLENLPGVQEAIKAAEQEK